MSSDDSSIFIVGGDITVNSDVDRIDGIYITNGTFSDGDIGNTLVVDGSVYARTVDLSRVNSENSLPSESFVFNPKYLDLLTDVVGVPTVSWKEVAP